MIREFNKQRRNGPRPSFRDTSSSRYGEGQPSRPPRPRLNRERVDRAWEVGAQHNHADYRPRSSSGYSQQNRRNDQRPGYPSPQNRSGTHNMNGYKRDNTHHSERTPGGYQNFRTPSSDTNRYHSDRQNFRTPSSDTNRYHSDRQNFRTPSSDTNRYHSDRQNFGERRNNPDGRNNRGPYRRPDRDDQRPNYRRNDGPRWQQRPRHQAEEQFEGDYEHFTGHDDHDGLSTRHTSRGQNNNDPKSRKKESHVTRLPDGHVLKGPRPVQKRNAQFWTDVTTDTDELIKTVQSPETVDEEHTPTQKKARTRPENTKAKARGNKATNTKPGTDNLKPSQRGFKWPAP